MDQDALVGLLAKQVDSLGSILTWYVAISCAATYAALRNRQEVALGPVNIDARHAQAVGSALVIVFGLGILICLLRIRALLSHLDFDHIDDGLTVVFASTAIANPFAYFGEGVLDRASSVLSYGLFFLIVGSALLPVISADEEDKKLARATFWLWSLISLLICVMVMANLMMLYVLSSRYSIDLSKNLASTFVEKNFILPFVPFIMVRLHRRMLEWQSGAA